MKRKQFTAPVDPTLGLNLSTNPLALKPGEMIGGENFIVAKPGGFINSNPEMNHTLSTKPPVHRSVVADYGFSVASTQTNVKPLIGAETDPTDSIVGHWQSIAAKKPEVWTVTAGGKVEFAGATYPSNAMPLTASDGDGDSLLVSPLTVAVDITATLSLSSPYSAYPGNRSKLYVNVLSPAATFKIRIGCDSSNYLEFNVAAENNESPRLIKKELREYTTLVGNFSKAVSKLIWAQIHIEDGDPFHCYAYVDHIRLDVSYLGFYGDFTSQAAYRQTSIETMDTSDVLSRSTWVLGDGYYAERRLSIGNGCLAFEAIPSTALSKATATISPVIPYANFPSSPGLAFDYQAENSSMLGSCYVRVGNDASNYWQYDLTGVLVDGNNILPIVDFPNGATGWLPPTSVGTPVLANGIGFLEFEFATGSATPAAIYDRAARVYLSNVRLFPAKAASPIYVIPKDNGMIRDLNIYESTNGGDANHFIQACGDALFLGGNALSPVSWYIQGGFNNWSPADSVIYEKPFCGILAVNPDYAPTGTAASAYITFTGFPSVGNTITINGVVFTFIAATTGPITSTQIVIASTVAAQVANAALTISAYFLGSFAAVSDGTSKLTVTSDQRGTSGNDVTISIVGSYGTLSGSKFTGGVEPFGQPENLYVFVNSVDGIWTVGIMNYVKADGTIYPYPIVKQVDKRPFSSIEVFNGRVMASGDPAHPNRICYSDANDCNHYQPGSFIELDLQGYVTTGDSIKAIRKYEEVLLVCRGTDVHLIYGDNPYNYSQKRTSADIGPIGPRHVVIAQRRVFFLAYNGVYEFAGYKTKCISSEKVHDPFQHGSMAKAKASFISYNPVREIVIATIIHEYTVDPMLGTHGTYSVEQYVYSLKNGAWSRIRLLNDTGASDYRTDFMPVSAVYFGGASQAPTYYQSSTNLLTWEKYENVAPIPTYQSFLCSANFAVTGIGSPINLKVFDKIFVMVDDPIARLWSIGYSTLMSGGSATTLSSGLLAEANGYIEELFDSGCVARQIGPIISVTSYNNTTPISIVGFSLSYFFGEEP